VLRARPLLCVCVLRARPLLCACVLRARLPLPPPPPPPPRLPLSLWPRLQRWTSMLNGLHDLLLLPCSAFHRSLAGRQRTNGLPDLLLLPRSAGPCGPAGRRRTAERHHPHPVGRRLTSGLGRVFGGRARAACCLLQLHHLHNPMTAVAPLDNCNTCAPRAGLLDPAERRCGPASLPPSSWGAGRAGGPFRPPHPPSPPSLPQQLPTPHTQSPHTTSFNPNPSPPMWGPSPSPVRLLPFLLLP
jgi:hypothetical protein